MEITREVLRQVRDDMNKAFAAIGEKHGLLLECGRGTFTSSTATLKVEMAIGTGSEGGEHAKAEADWNRLAESFGFDVQWLGKSFRSGTETWTILGLRPSRVKYPVLASNSRDTVRLLTVQTVLMGMAAAKAEKAVRKAAQFVFEIDGYTMYPEKNRNTKTRNGIRTVCPIYRDGVVVATLDDIPERIVTPVAMASDGERLLMLTKAKAALKAKKFSALGEKRPSESTLLSEYARYISMAADEAWVESQK